MNKYYIHSAGNLTTARRKAIIWGLCNVTDLTATFGTSRIKYQFAELDHETGFAIVDLTYIEDGKQRHEREIIMFATDRRFSEAAKVKFDEAVAKRDAATSAVIKSFVEAIKPPQSSAPVNDSNFIVELFSDDRGEARCLFPAGTLTEDREAVIMFQESKLGLTDTLNHRLKSFRMIANPRALDGFGVLTVTPYAGVPYRVPFLLRYGEENYHPAAVRDWVAYQNRS